MYYLQKIIINITTHRVLNGNTGRWDVECVLVVVVVEVEVLVAVVVVMPGPWGTGEREGGREGGTHPPHHPPTPAATDDKMWSMQHYRVTSLDKIFVFSFKRNNFILHKWMKFSVHFIKKATLSKYLLQWFKDHHLYYSTDVHKTGSWWHTERLSKATCNWQHDDLPHQILCFAGSRLGWSPPF